jgi:hypothetical protein
MTARSRGSSEAWAVARRTPALGADSLHWREREQRIHARADDCFAIRCAGTSDACSPPLPPPDRHALIGGRPGLGAADLRNRRRRRGDHGTAIRRSREEPRVPYSLRRPIGLFASSHGGHANPRRRALTEVRVGGCPDDQTPPAVRCSSVAGVASCRLDSRETSRRPTAWYGGFSARAAPANFGSRVARDVPRVLHPLRPIQSHGCVGAQI